MPATPRARPFLATALAVLLLNSCAAASPAPLTSATRADAAFTAFQSAYYDGYGHWRGASYWQTAQAFTLLLDEVTRTHNPQLTALISLIYTADAPHRAGDFTATYVDDEGWWAVDWLRAYDLTHDRRYLATAEQVFTAMAATWDDTCDGGVWWKATKQYKNAIANELFLLVGALLAQRTTGSAAQSYRQWAEREWHWFGQSGMISGNGLINDGLNDACQNNGGMVWSYNQGVILAGLATLYQVTHDRSLLQAADRTAQAAITHLRDDQGVLDEKGCDLLGCGADGELFKGIFARYLWVLSGVDPQPAYRSFLQTTLAALWQHDRTASGTFGLSWSGLPKRVTVNTTAAAAMVLTATALPPSAVFAVKGH